MRLRYKAASKEGKLTQGLLDAKDIEEAAAYLRSKNLLPISITRIDNQLSTKIPFLNKISTQDVILFTRQMSSMLSSGLTLLKSLELLKEQTTNPAMAEIITSVITDIQEGKTFGGAISKYPKAFDDIYVSIIKAGESSGLLDNVLLRLADNLEKHAKLRSTIKGALMYPVIVITLMLVVMLVMMLFVIPQLTTLYQSLNIELPLPTKILIGVTDFIRIFWPIVIGGIAAFGYFFHRWSKTLSGTLILDNLILKLPIFGKLVKQSILAEFARTFGLLVGTGTLVVEALSETANITGNIHYKNAIELISKQVEKGVTVGTAMGSSSLFPPLLVQLVKIGEQTGKIDETLQKASEYFEREVDLAVKNLTTAMEPFIMIVLGIGVAFLIISVITPIYSLISSIK